MNADEQKRRQIQAKLKVIESKNDAGEDQGQRHSLANEVQGEVETVADPVLKTEYQRQLSALRGK